MEEKELWSDHPSEVHLWGLYLSCGLLCILGSQLWWPLVILPVSFAVFKHFELRENRYTLTSERLFHKKGVFLKKERFIELYRIKEYRVIQPWYYKMFDISDLILKPTSPIDDPFIIKAVHNPYELRDHIRKYVERSRDKKRIREIDFEYWDNKN